MLVKSADAAIASGRIGISSGDAQNGPSGKITLGSGTSTAQKSGKVSILVGQSSQASEKMNTFQYFEQHEYEQWIHLGQPKCHFCKNKYSCQTLG